MQTVKLEPVVAWLLNMSSRRRIPKILNTALSFFFIFCLFQTPTTAFQSSAQAAASLPAFSSCKEAGNPTSYSSAGSGYSFTVPDGCKRIRIKVWGAGGGSGGGGDDDSPVGSASGAGGPGGYVEVVFGTRGGESFSIAVGGAGGYGQFDGDVGTGGGGGGASKIQFNSVDFIIAGGGGGGGGGNYNNNLSLGQRGGSGGGLAGGGTAQNDGSPANATC